MEVEEVAVNWRASWGRRLRSGWLILKFARRVSDSEKWIDVLLGDG